MKYVITPKMVVIEVLLFAASERGLVELGGQIWNGGLLAKNA